MHLLIIILNLILTTCNMNNGGIPYLISNPDNLNGDYSTLFSDEYFEVYSPVKTRYSQVYWIRNDPVALPDSIVNRFKGKLMAITGYEADQVFKTENGDVSVPIYWAYNHHWFAWLLGSDAELIYDKNFYTKKNPTNWKVQSKNNKSYDSIVFKENPGGEYRKSYHGYPKGFAQLIYSPTSFVIEPMQIDTHNRNYTGTGYQPWFIPKIMQNQTDPNSHLSPLIECPCTDRINKLVINQSNILISGLCQKIIPTVTDCIKASEQIITINQFKNISSYNYPPGCIISPSSLTNSRDTKYNVLFNSQISSTSECGNPETLPGPLHGFTSSLVNLTLDIDSENDLVTITMVGPNGVWFGVGFNAGEMADMPYAIIIDGSGLVTERKLAYHDPGYQLVSSVKVIKNSVTNSFRTVLMTRPLVGKTPDHYSFEAEPGVIKFINAIGSGPDLGYHKARTASQITIIPITINSCLCSPTPTDYISYMNQTLEEYSVYCAPEPRSDMKMQNNPACHLSSYKGGLHCCKHQWFLTDQNQESDIPLEYDYYYMKFRYYFREYDQTIKGLHHWVFLIDQEINDYEEIKCADGTMCQGMITAHLQVKDMGLEDVPLNITNMTKIIPIIVTAHCHAPSCIREELYNADTGDLICSTNAIYGTGSEPFNEKDYIAIPPCLFGFEPGLKRPITLTLNTNLTAIKIFNNTFRHLGQMAQWTGLVIYSN